MRHILVTGAAGFIGANISDGFDRPSVSNKDIQLN